MTGGKIPYRVPTYIVLSRRPNSTRYEVVKIGRGHRIKYESLYKELNAKGIPARFMIVTSRKKRKKNRNEAGKSNWTPKTQTKE